MTVTTTVMIGRDSRIFKVGLVLQLRSDLLASMSLWRLSLDVNTWAKNYFLGMSRYESWNAISDQTTSSLNKMFFFTFTNTVSIQIDFTDYEGCSYFRSKYEFQFRLHCRKHVSLFLPGKVYRVWCLMVQRCGLYNCKIYSKVK